MTTLREKFESEIERLEEMQDSLEFYEENHPAILDMDLPRFHLYYWGLVVVWDDTPESKGIAAKIASALGVKDSLMKEKSSVGMKTEFHVPGGHPLMDFTVYHQANGCKKYRVVKEEEIEICGEIDKDKYLSVEEIAE